MRGSARVPRSAVQGSSPSKSSWPVNGSSQASHIGSGCAPQRPDPLLNPLRVVLRSFTCVECGHFDPSGTADGKGAFQCRRCVEGDGPASKRCAYTTLLYGDKTQFVLGALALGQSLLASGTSHDRILLHTEDVPMESRQLLEEFWSLRQVAYIWSAPDLHTAPYEKARFKEIFTKLQALNPEVLPYDRVVFLDLDTLVLKNIDELFELRPPAAMCNGKERSGRACPVPPHRGRMDAQSCYFNAGTMVLAPSAPLFDLLAADVQEPDPMWHRSAWSPEQSYLSYVLAGEWSHVSQIYNMEVQLHSGVPLSQLWEEAQASDIAVAHFSGHTKVWDASPEKVAHVLGSEFSQQAFARLSARSRHSVGLRCQALHAQWHLMLSEALRRCRERDVGSKVGIAWAAAISTGEPPRSNMPKCLSVPTQDGPLVGCDVTLSEEDGTIRLAKVIRVRGGGDVGAGGQENMAPNAKDIDVPMPLRQDSRPREVLKELVVWRTPSPSAEAPFCPGAFGLCITVPAALAQPLVDGGAKSADDDEFILGMGDEAVAWLGTGHARGLIIASRGDLRLLRFEANVAPRWFREERLQLWKGGGQGEPLD